jgi:hypothetical protein
MGVISFFKAVKHFLLAVLLCVSMAASLVPVPVDAAGLVPCGRNDGTPAEQAPCTVCHVIVGGVGVIKWGLSIMTVLGITVAFAMAVLYVVSAGDQGMMSTAKGGIKAVLVGFAIMLSAWLIVNIVLTILIDPNDTSKPLGGLVQDGTFSFSCDVSSNVNR